MMLDRTRYDPEPRRRRAPPAGYETLGVDWDRLTPTKTAIVCAFADALREIRRNELELLRLGTIDYIRSMCDAMRELRAEHPSAPPWMWGGARTRISACNAVRDRNSPIKAHQINLQRSLSNGGIGAQSQSRKDARPHISPLSARPCR
jgi:hypothetical protein